MNSHLIPFFTNSKSLYRVFVMAIIASLYGVELVYAHPSNDLCVDAREILIPLGCNSTAAMRRPYQLKDTAPLPIANFRLIPVVLDGNPSISNTLAPCRTLKPDEVSILNFYPSLPIPSSISSLEPVRRTG